MLLSFCISDIPAAGKRAFGYTRVWPILRGVMERWKCSPTLLLRIETVIWYEEVWYVSPVVSDHPNPPDRH